MSTKKSEPKSREPTEEPYRPMAVPDPDPLDRIEALEATVLAMKEWINKHNRSHYRENVF